jgi:hypothetical protein
MYIPTEFFSDSITVLPQTYTKYIVGEHTTT